MNDRETVRALLAAAGFEPPDEDLPGLERDYATVRAMTALLYTVDAARYENPALRFVVDWC